MKMPQRAPRSRFRTIAGLAISPAGAGADAGELAVEPRLAITVRDLRTMTARGARAVMLRLNTVVVGWDLVASIAIR